MSSRSNRSSSDVVTRRRDDVLMDAIREATRAELAQHGYPGVTFEGVARRAKTSKPVLYRRYRSRAHMVVDALIVLQTASGPVATRTLRGDMLAMLNGVLIRFELIGIGTYRNLIAEADAELLDTIIAQLAELATRTIYHALSAARDRGEIGPAEIPVRAATSIIALMRNEVFFTHHPVDKNALIDMVDNVYLPLIDTLSHRPRPAESK